MRLTIAKPAIPAFEGDLKSSFAALEAIASELGMSGRELRINEDLTLDLGLQLIVREKDLANMGKLEATLATLPNVPFAIHAPYNYDDDPSHWASADLSEGDVGLTNLKKVVAFGDAIGASSIAVHPNSVRESAVLVSPSYNAILRQGYLTRVIANIEAARSHARHVSVDLENKPFPATTAHNERPMFGTTFAPIEDILAYLARGGGRVTFDTCHYGITRETINGTRARLGGDLSDGRLKKEGILGYLAEDFQAQPSIEEAMLLIGERINHIHLNDGSMYRPHEATGKPDRSKPLPQVGGMQLWWEAYVPGRGELCDNKVIMPWIRQHQRANRKIPLTVEVTEFDRNYDHSPRFREAAVRVIRDISDEFSH